MEDRDKILDCTKPIRLPDDCSKNRKNFTKGYFYREIGRYKNTVPSEFQWAAEDKLINKSTYEELKCQFPDSPRSTFLMVFSPDGKKVASTHGNHNVYVTDLTTGKNIQTLSGHPRTPWCIAFHPSSNQILASGCLGGQVRVWDLHGGSEVWTAESQTVIASLAFHPVDRMLVIATYNELHFWDWSQPEPFAKCSTKSGREKVRYVSFDRLGNKLITGIANPVNVPSQWDRISLVNSQPPMTSTTTTTTTTASLHSTVPTAVATTQSSSNQRSLASWCRNIRTRYNQLVNMSRNTPTIDRGTDPMDLLDLRSNTNNSESSTNNPSSLPSSSSTSNSQTHSSSPLRFKITRSACRSYRPISSRERFRIHSSVFRRLSSRSSLSSNSLSTATTNTPRSQGTGFTMPSSVNSTTASSPPPRLRRCAFNLCPTARSWCLTLSPENSSNFLTTRNSSQSETSSGAVTNPTYTSYSTRGIFSTRVSNSNNSERSQFSVVRPYRLLFNDISDVRSTQREMAQPQREEISSESRSNSLSVEQTETLRIPSQESTSNSGERSSNRDAVLNSPNGVEIERVLQRPSSDIYLRRQESESVNSSHHNSSVELESLSGELTRNSRSSSTFQLTPVNLRDVSPVRRFGEDANSDGELGRTRNNQFFPQSLMHPRPVPRFQVRSRLLQDQQSQLHLLTNRETHGLNLQNNQSLRRQLSFRPGGQFVLSRHSNSPFQPRVPHQIDNPVQMNSPVTVKNIAKNSRPEIPSLSSSFTTSISSNNTESVTSTSPSSGNSFSSSVASNLSFTGEGTSRQLREQINRRLFDRVKMMLRDRIRNSSENASTDSTVNYSRISGESEAETRNLLDSSLESEEGNTSRGLGPRGIDPLLSSASENLDTSIEGLLLPSSENLSLNSASSSNNNGLNVSHSDLLDPWESETDAGPFSMNSSLSMNDILTDQTQSTQESTSQEGRGSAEQNTIPTTSTDASDNLNSSPELSMRQGIQLLSLHIENMQRLCLARIEILQLQKIRGIWEDLTNQIRHFHNVIQSRSSGGNGESSSNSRQGESSSNPRQGESSSNSRQDESSSNPRQGESSSNSRQDESSSNSRQGERSSNSGQGESSNSSGQNENSNSNGDIPSIRNLAISGSSIPESNSRSSTTLETSNDAGIINSYKALVESMVNEFLIDSKKLKSSGNAFKNSNQESTAKPNNSQNFGSTSSMPSTNETEEPQPGPSGLSTPSTSRGVRNSKLHLEYRVYRLLRDIIQRTRRRRDMREPASSSSSGLLRQYHWFRLRNNSRTRFRGQRYNRHVLDSSSSRSRALSRKLDAIWQTWKNERLNKPSHSTSSPNSLDPNQPSTSTQRDSNSNDACQSCGQKKKPNREFCRQKRKSVDSLSGLGTSGSASKALKNNVGKRSEAPSREVPGEGVPSTSNESGSSSSQSQDNSTSELLKQMLQTMETMLRFQGEAFRRIRDLTERRPSRPSSSSEDDSDGDQNDSNEQSEVFMRHMLRNFLVTREVIRNLVPDIAFFRAKRFGIMLGYLVKGLNQFIGKNVSNLSQVLDEQIFSLSMLLDLALELTDLQLDQLNARNRDLERSWTSDNTNENDSRNRERFWLLSRSPSIAGRMRERSRNFGRSSFNSSFSTRGEDNFRTRSSSNPFLRSHSRLISTRLNSSSNTSHDRFSNTLLSNLSRRKRRTARMSTFLPSGWYYRRPQGQSNNATSGTSGTTRTMNGSSVGSHYRGFRFEQRPNGNDQSRSGIRAFDYEINNNSSSSNATNNNNYSLYDDSNNNNINNNNSNNNNNNDNNINNGNNNDNRNTGYNSDISNNNINNSFINYYFPNNGNSNNSESGNSNIIILTGLNSSNDVNSNDNAHRNINNEENSTRQSGTNTFLSHNSLPPLRSMELTLSRSESGDLSLRDERPIFWIRYGGNNETSSSSNSSDSHSRINSFTVPVVQVNDVPVSVSDVSMLNQPRHRPQSPVPRVPEDIWRWRAWRPRFLHPRYGGPNPFDDQDSNDVPENIHYYRILSTSAGSHLGVYTLDPMIITDAPLSPHHRIQAWDFSKMNIPDISDREANGVVPECKIHNDASVDVSNDGHLLVTLLPSGRLSVTTMLGVYSLDWSSLGQLLYRTSFEQSAVSVSLSPTNRHLLVGLASRPVVVRDRTNMAQIFRLEGGRPSPHGGSWQSGRGRLVHMRDLEHTRETNIMSLNCIRWAPGAGQGLVYGTNTGQLKVLR